MSSPAANLPPRLQNFSLSERGRTYIIVFSILEFFVFTTVALRCISKRNNRTIGLDDWLILLALFFELGVYVTGVLANVLGFGGFHVWELYPDQISLCLLFVYIHNIFYALTLPTIKFSLLAMYWKIFHRVKAFRYATFVLGSIVFGWLVAVLFVQVFTCSPISAAWDVEIQGKCVDQTKFYYGNAIPNVLTDVAILVLPLRLVWQLQMSAQRKVALSSVVLLGSFVCISSILRIITFGQITEDITFTLCETAIWTAVEVPLAIICACLPTLPALFKAWRKQLTPGFTSGTSSLLRFFRTRDDSRQPNTEGSYEHLEYEMRRGNGFTSDAKYADTRSLERSLEARPSASP